jgi:RimJ/RimL family protein N-acetyltransferase
LIDKAFTDLDVERVVADTMAVNTKSRRVMVKSGLRFVRVFHVHFDDPLPGTEHGEVEYAVDRATWTVRPGPCDLEAGLLR